MAKRRVFFVISVLSAGLLPIHIYTSSPLPVAGILLGLLLFPIASIWKDFESSSYDVLYIGVFSVALGFTLAYGSPYPVGYNDTFRHLQFALEAGPRMPTGEILSHAFGLTYIIPYIISVLFNIPVEDTARIFPGLLYATTVLIFFTLLSRSLLERSRWQLTATILFAANWGVFRFMIEYRTLNISLATGVLFLGILVNIGRIRERFSILGVIAVTVLAISHFATFLFILLIATLYGISRSRSRVAPSIFQLITLGGCITVAYLLFLHQFNTVGESLFYIYQEFIIASEPANASDPIESTVSMPYGFQVFILDWFRRGFVGLACLTVTGLAIKNRDRDHIFLVLAGGATGGILAVTFVTGFALLPPRIMTFFAIPAGLIVGVVLESSITFSPDKARRAIRVIAIVVVILSVIIPMAKLPNYIIGETEPIRDEAPVDEDYSLRVSHQDLAQLEFTNVYVRDSVSDHRGRFISYYFGRGQASYLWEYQQPNTCDIVYDSGSGVLYVTSEANCSQF